MGAGSQLDSMWPLLLPIVMGLMAAFKPFVDSRDVFRRRFNELRITIEERLAVKHAALLQHLRRIIDVEIELLRGDGKNQPDLVADLVEATSKLFTILQGLRTLSGAVGVAYGAIFTALCLGIVGALASLLWADAQACAYWGGFVLVGVQIVFFVLLMWASSKLRTYENLA